MNTKPLFGIVPIAMLFACAAGNEAALADGNTMKWDFQGASVGKLHGGWTSDHTGSGKGSVWEVVEDADSPDGSRAIAQVSAEGSGGFFSLCVADNARFEDLVLTISFKAVAGKEDQGGGPVWRYKDANNYYIARMNPLEDNFRVYKVENGKRTELGSADVKAAAGAWHTIRIEHTGDRIQCSLNGKVYLDVNDATFPGAGKIGLWTKADAQTRFAAIGVESEVAQLVFGK